MQTILSTMFLLVKMLQLTQGARGSSTLVKGVIEDRRGYIPSIVYYPLYERGPRVATAELAQQVSLVCGRL
jgi:hypothetical protein